MKFYRLYVVYSNSHMAEKVFNDEQVAVAEFKAQEKSLYVRGLKLYTCNFVCSVLTDKDCIKQA